MHRFYYEFQVILSASISSPCVAAMVVIASQLITPSPFTSLWDGSVYVEFFSSECLDQRKIVLHVLHEHTVHEHIRNALGYRPNSTFKVFNPEY